MGEFVIFDELRLNILCKNWCLVGWKVQVYYCSMIPLNISIVVEMEESGKVELYITYQVYCASWKPCYDIRASSAEEEEDSQNGSSVQLCYYGLVEQNTGDDWKDCDIVLSTCSASLGGSPPPLSTLSASLHSSRPTRRHHASSAARRKAPLSIPSEEDMGFGSFDYNDIVDAAAYHRWHNGQHSRSSEENSVSTQALENTVSTCFSIPRAVTILSNAVEHKLLIVKSDLSCAFSHETVPSRSTSAYLSALITNTSQLPLLPGAVAVYVNNCFVTKVGFMSKSTLMTHEQLISVRSAKVRQSVKITVKEQIPKSHDDKIKVSIVSPEIKSSSSYKNSASPPDARLNKDHNLEWCVVLAPGQHRLLPVRYTIEHPASESLSYKLN
ncbi:Protein CBG00355 [Caenorhabditis briggsae]|uniref:Protein CBG00355 n=1 Tax=Caenorhabditis briggsae TaxID=6238 RepID=A8WMW4_CAEBR|nr:Protein CBG00355 [Caenorhabditis briggsae]CAP21819.2 Protein CBG00355 [Caenorhabditis briggsae]